MGQRSRGDGTVVITTAPYPKTLDVRDRTHRYLWTMGLRVACFLALVVVPGFWPKLVCGAAAAILPAVAVLLANASDNHKPPVADDHAEPVAAPALPAGVTLTGHVVDE